VTITPSTGTLAVGDVLTCNSDSSLSSYLFTDVLRASINDNRATLTEAGSFSFTCTATVAMDTPCSAEVSVSGTAVGKEEISKDRFGKRKKNRIKKEMTVYKIIITS